MSGRAPGRPSAAGGRGGAAARRGVALALLAAAAAATPAPATDGGSTGAFAITDVTVIDGSGGAPLPHRTVTVRQGRIAAIEPAGGEPALDVALVAAAGKYLIPGLWDMHVHLGYAGDVALPAMIANGVTGARDLGGSLELIDWWRARVEAGALVGPRILRAGPFVDGAKPGAPDRLVVDSTEDGRRAAAFLAGRGVDFIKVHTATPPDAYFALLAEAVRLGVGVVGHLPLAVDPAAAIAAGHRSVEHIVALFEGPVRRKIAAGMSQEQAIAEFTDAEAAALGRLMAEHRTWFDPTLVGYRARTLRLNAPDDADPRHRYASASLRDFWARTPELPDTLEVRERLAAGWRRFVEVARVVRRAGVRFLAGTDLGAPNLYPGFSLHDELQILVEDVGFTPLEALSVATRDAAESLGRLDELGTIEVGKAADLVLLDADPLAAIGNTRAIAAVVAAGRLYRRPELEAMLAEVAARAAER